MGNFINEIENTLIYLNEFKENNKIKILTEIVPSQDNTDFSGEFNVDFVFVAVDSTGKSEVVEVENVKVRLNPNWNVKTNKEFLNKINVLLDSASGDDFASSLSKDENKELTFVYDDYKEFNTCLIGSSRFAELLRRNVHKVYKNTLNN